MAVNIKRLQRHNRGKLKSQKWTIEQWKSEQKIRKF